MIQGVAKVRLQVWDQTLSGLSSKPAESLVFERKPWRKRAQNLVFAGPDLNRF
jgi:hypothetical protein